jgi:hypothetical protein
MLNEYPIFAEYHFFMKCWLKRLMELPRINKLDKKIPVVYSTPRRAFALGSSSEQLGDAGGEPYYAPPNQGNNWLPILTFHYTNATPQTGKIIPYEHVLKSKVKDNNNNVVGERRGKPFLVYEINYTATLYTGLMQDMDILVYRFMTEFRPQHHLWIGQPGTEGDGTKGVWAHMILDGVTDATEYEPGDIGERVVRKDFSWTVTEAYVPTVAAQIDDNIIEEVYADINEFPGGGRMI